MTEQTPKPGKVSLAKKQDTAPASTEATAAPGAYGDGLTLILTRNSFYKNNYYNLARISVIQFFTLLVLIATVSRLFQFTDSRDYFFAVQEDNELIIDYPMFEPRYTHEELEAWIENAITESLTFGYYDYATRLQESRRFFTTIGFANFLKALEEANITAKISGNGANNQDPQVIQTQIKPNGRAKVVEEAVNGGYYLWKIEMGVNVTFISNLREHREAWKLEIIITRVPTTMGRYGIGIDQVIAKSDI